MAGVGPNAVRPDQLGPRVGRAGNVLGDDAAGIAGRTAADRRPIVQPLDPPGLLQRNARPGVQVQPVHILVGHVVEKDVAIQVFHHPAAQLVDDLLRLSGLEQRFGRLGQQPEPPHAFLQGRFPSLALRNVLHHPDGAHNRAGAVADVFTSFLDDADLAGRFPDYPMLDVVPRLAVPERLGISGVDDRSILGMDGIKECVVGGVKHLRLQPKNAVDLVGPGEAVMDEIQFPTAEMGDFLPAVQPLFALL